MKLSCFLQMQTAMTSFGEVTNSTHSIFIINSYSNVTLLFKNNNHVLLSNRATLVAIYI